MSRMKFQFRRVVRCRAWLPATVLATLLGLGRAQAQPSLEQRFLWDQANAEMAVAHTPGDFLEAARTYRRLTELGVVNGPLLYNMGTALLLGEQYAAAAAVLERSERFMGSTPALLQNLRLALAGHEDDAMDGLPWYRTVLFWHYGLATTTRITIACAAFSLLWLGAALLLLGWRKVAVRCMVLAGVILVVFGSSVITSLLDESRFDDPMATMIAGETE